MKYDVEAYFMNVEAEDAESAKKKILDEHDGCVVHNVYEVKDFEVGKQTQSKGE